MSEIRDLAVWVFVLLMIAGVASWVLMMVSAIATRVAFMRYSENAMPSLSYFKKHRLYNQMIFSPDKYQSDFGADQTGQLRRFLVWRNRLILGATSFVSLAVGAWVVVGLFKFLAYVYIKGQQAG